MGLAFGDPPFLLHQLQNRAHVWIPFHTQNNIKKFVSLLMEGILYLTTLSYCFMEKKRYENHNEDDSKERLEVVLNEFENGAAQKDEKFS